MSKSFRLTSAASLVALATIIAGCATPQNRVATSGKAKADIGLATRALAALEANDFSTAITFAERAVDANPGDAGVRALLGNTYFAAGRFASAESAYKDALALSPDQSTLILKLALVQIGQGKHADAIGLLESNRSRIDPADFGLALTLAGRAADAIPVLEAAARIPNAGGRVRQNLALAYAFAGDWERSRMVASQDVPAGQLDARMQQWIELAKPAKTWDQVAALTGVTPAASDPGQPVRLALQQPQAQMAQAAPAPAPQPAFVEAAPISQAAEIAPAPQPQFAEAAPPPPPPPPPPVFEEAPMPVPPPSAIAAMAAAAPEAPAAFVALAPKVRTPKPAKLHRASVTAKLPPVRTAALRTGKSKAVVQLGAYRSPQHVNAAWNTLTQRYPALRSYLPLRARFDSPKGTFYRLSIQGFGTQQEAIARCRLLKSRGGNCFVRNVAGDAPIQIASR
jgi:Flp pilus assembly protein TadD